MKKAIYDALIVDATLSAILTGGIFYNVVEITRQNTPDAFDDNNEILPCLLIKATNDSHNGPYDHSTRLTLAFYFYERFGYENIDSAMLRVYQLLHKQRLSPEFGSCWEILHDNDIPNQEDQALMCTLGISRYQIYRNRI